MAEVTVFDKLGELAGAIRSKTGITTLLSLDQMKEAVLGLDKGASTLNYQIVTVRPDKPVENTIYVDTFYPISKHAFSITNPWITSVQTELLSDATIVDGYYSDTGVITAQNATNKEVRTDNYIPVKFGKNYEWSYKLPESKSMFFAILEYDGSKTLLGSRLEPINGVTGTEQTGVFTPTYGNTAYIRLSWRTFGLDCTVSLMGPVDYTDQSEADGAVWFKTSYYSYVDFNAHSTNQLQVYPVQALQYYNGYWHELECQTFKNNDWKQWVPYGSLYWHGNSCEEESGGWQGLGRARSSSVTANQCAPLVIYTDDYMLITHNPTAGTQATGLAETVILQDLTDVNMIAVDCEGRVYDSGIRVTLCANTAAGNLDGTVCNLELLYPSTGGTVPETLPRDTYYIDVSALSGQYKIAFKALDNWSAGVGKFELKVYSVRKIYNEGVL